MPSDACGVPECGILKLHQNYRWKMFWSAKTIAKNQKLQWIRSLMWSFTTLHEHREATVDPPYLIKGQIIRPLPWTHQQESSSVPRLWPDFFALYEGLACLRDEGQRWRADAGSPGLPRGASPALAGTSEWTWLLRFMNRLSGSTEAWEDCKRSFGMRVKQLSLLVPAKCFPSSSIGLEAQICFQTR